MYQCFYEVISVFTSDEFKVQLYVYCGVTKICLLQYDDEEGEEEEVSCILGLFSHSAQCSPHLALSSSYSGSQVQFSGLKILFSFLIIIIIFIYGQTPLLEINSK